jgi:hypothetical protein
MNKEDESHLKFLGVHAEVIEFMKKQHNINKMDLTEKEYEFVRKTEHEEIDEVQKRIDRRKADKKDSLERKI